MKKIIIFMILYLLSTSTAFAAVRPYTATGEYIMSPKETLEEGSSRMPMRTKETPREGIVIRPLEYIEERDDRFVGGRLSFKAINPDFMIKYKL